MLYVFVCVVSAMHVQRMSSVISVSMHHRYHQASVISMNPWDFPLWLEGYRSGGGGPWALGGRAADRARQS